MQKKKNKSAGIRLRLEPDEAQEIRQTAQKLGVTTTFLIKYATKAIDQNHFFTYVALNPPSYKRRKFVG